MRELIASCVLLLLVTRYSSMIVDTKTKKRKAIKWALEMVVLFVSLDIIGRI